MFFAFFVYVEVFLVNFGATRAHDFRLFRQKPRLQKFQPLFPTDGVSLFEALLELFFMRLVVFLVPFLTVFLQLFFGEKLSFALWLFLSLI